MLEAVVTFPVREILSQQGYKFVGRHSAIKFCHWLRKSLYGKGACYKGWYGISSHRCIQMSPMVIFCSHQCVFCWRVQSSDTNLKWKQYFNEEPLVDDPEDICEWTIKAQKKCLQGYLSDPNVNREKLREAFEPKHVAISLSGEPCMYPRLSSLIEEYRSRGLTTFLVTNGTYPHRLRSLESEPTQLYVSLTGYDENTYLKVARPMIKNGWEKIMESLGLLSSFSCPTVIRLTLVKGLNLKNPGGYAKLIETAEPTYVEAKAAMHIGYSRKRISGESMPSFSDIKKFSVKLEEETGYKIIRESLDSRVVLLSRLRSPVKVA